LQTPTELHLYDKPLKLESQFLDCIAKGKEQKHFHCSGLKAD